MLATTTNLNRFLNKAERIIRNNYNEKGLIVCARIDNVFAIEYNGIPFILSVNVAPFNVIVYNIALSSDSKNYIIKSRGTCGNQEAVISDIYVDLLYYVRDNNICLETAETTEKHYIENDECAKGNDVFEDCKTVKEKEQYFDTDTLQPNKTITAKIENINHCPNQNTCCIVSPFVHCNYNYKSDSCIKAHKNFIHDCEQVHKQMKARSNPEWHHVSLATLANIDIDMLDETRQIYMHVRYQLNRVIKAIYKCNRCTTMDILRTSIIQHIENLLRNKKVNRSLLRYAEAQIDNCYLVNGVISSKYAGSYSEKSSRAYKKYFCL